MISAQSNLTRLSISGWNVSDEGVSALCKLPALTDLYLRECPRVTEACKESLLSRRPGLKINDYAYMHSFEREWMS